MRFTSDLVDSDTPALQRVSGSMPGGTGVLPMVPLRTPAGLLFAVEAPLLLILATAPPGCPEWRYLRRGRRWQQ